MTQVISGIWFWALCSFWKHITAQWKSKHFKSKETWNIFTPWTVFYRFYLQLLHTKSAESWFCSSKLELFSSTFWKRWNWWVFGVWIIWRTLNSSYTPNEYFMFCGNKPTYRPTLYIHLHSTPLHPIKFHFKKRTSQKAVLLLLWAQCC